MAIYQHTTFRIKVTVEIDIKTPDNNIDGAIKLTKHIKDRIENTNILCHKTYGIIPEPYTSPNIKSDVEILSSVFFQATHALPLSDKTYIFMMNAGFEDDPILVLDTSQKAVNKDVDVIWNEERKEYVVDITFIKDRPYAKYKDDYILIREIE